MINEEVGFGVGEGVGVEVGVGVGDGEGVGVGEGDKGVDCNVNDQILLKLPQFPLLSLALTFQ